MAIERDLILSILKLTKGGSVSVEMVNKTARIAPDIIKKLLEKMQNEDLIYLHDGAVEARGNNRLRLVIRAASLGADVENVSVFLRWQEFEDIAALAFERHGYVVDKNLRFKNAGRRWEIDVVGCKKPLVLCADCKHWHHGVKPSALARIVKAQKERVCALANTLPSAALQIECGKWRKAKFVPLILSLFPSIFKFYDNVPVVPVLQLQDFLTKLPVYVESLQYFVKEFSHL